MVEAAYRKYPNPHSANVHTLDTIVRRVTSTGGLFSYRTFGTRWNVPAIALNVSPYSYSYIHVHIVWGLLEITFCVLTDYWDQWSDENQ